VESGTFSGGSAWGSVNTPPAGATNIQVICEENTGLVWAQWKTICDLTYSIPYYVTIDLKGTTLNPSCSVDSQYPE
jgi:hypothetical protein